MLNRWAKLNFAVLLIGDNFTMILLMMFQALSGDQNIIHQQTNNNYKWRE